MSNIDLKAAKRLELVKRESGLSQVAFAELCGVSQPSISRMMLGVQPITLEVLQNVCKKLKYSADWLVSGIGSAKMVEDKKKTFIDIKNLQVENLILAAKIKHLESKI